MCWMRGLGWRRLDGGGGAAAPGGGIHAADAAVLAGDDGGAESHLPAVLQRGGHRQGLHPVPGRQEEPQRHGGRQEASWHGHAQADGHGVAGDNPHPHRPQGRPQGGHRAARHRHRRVLLRRRGADMDTESGRPHRGGHRRLVACAHVACAHADQAHRHRDRRHLGEDGVARRRRRRGLLRPNLVLAGRRRSGRDIHKGDRRHHHRAGGGDGLRHGGHPLRQGRDDPGIHDNAVHHHGGRSGPRAHGVRQGPRA